VGIGATVALQAGFTYLPFMNTVFGSAPLPLDAWWSVIATGVAMYVLIGGVKWLEGRVRELRNDQPLSA
jgi:hypothetical protein